MTSEQNRRLCILLAVGLTSYGLGGCSSSPEDGSGTGGGPGGSSAGSGGPAGSNGSGAGGSTGIAGSGVQGAAGSVGAGGSSAGGSNATGGSSSPGGSGPAGSGGGGLGGSSSGAGGTGGVGTGGNSAGGRGGSTAGKGGSSGPAGASGLGGSTGGGGSGSCQKGQTKGSDVVIMGESFYAISPQYIQNRLQDNARKAGSLGASDKYRNVAVSGQNMNYIATTEWTEATKMPLKWVIMDGGGIDCLTGSSCPTCMGTFKTLLGKMATAGVTDVIYTRYPEPGAPPGSDSKLKGCLDSFQPGMQTACEGSTSPRCHWVDLRPVWVSGDTTDGLHPTQSGGNHVGDLIWSEMVKLCFAQ